MTEVLFGFHLRTAPVVPAGRTWHLSADDCFWPQKEDIALHRQLFIDACEGENQSPNGLGVYTLREDIDACHPLSGFQDTFLVGFSTTQENFARLADWRDVRAFEPFVSPAFRECWVNLGYDVTDSWLTSGLYTMTPHGAKNWIPASSLNPFGLFPELAPAEVFVRLCDARIPEHEPFGPVGLWVPKEQLAALRKQMPSVRDEGCLLRPDPS